MGSCFMQVIQGTSEALSQLGLGNEQKHRLAITAGLKAVFHVALVGLFLCGENGASSGSSCLGHGDGVCCMGELTFLSPIFRDSKGG